MSRIVLRGPGGRPLRVGVRAVALPVVIAATLALILASAASPDNASDAGPSVTQTKPKPQPKTKPSPQRQASTLKATGVARWGTSFSMSSGYERVSYVLVGVGDARAASRLPGISLVYMSGTSVPTGYFTGVSHAEALANDWLLKDGNGAYVMNAQYGHEVGDIGNPAYQRRFIENVVAFLRRTKTDGIFLDDIVAAPASLTEGPLPTKYPTPEDWENATVEFVAAIGKAFDARGYYLLANPSKFVSGDSRSDTGKHMADLFRRLAPHVDGLTCEYWLQNAQDLGQMRSSGTTWHQNWKGWQDLASVAQTSGVDFFGLMYGSGADVRAMRYGRTSFLLDWNGRGGALIFEPVERDAPYHPVLFRQLGLPVGPKIQRAPGVWQRPFRQGVVVVNTMNAPASVRIGSRVHTVAATDGLFAAAPRP